MTDKLEKKFFDTFDIEQKELIFKTMNCACGCHDCENCDKYKNNFSKTYPQITDNKLLELIVIVMLHEDLYGFPQNVNDLKENVLEQLIETYNKFSSSSYEYQQTAREIKQQVQTVFKKTK